MTRAWYVACAKVDSGPLISYNIKALEAKAWTPEGRGLAL